MFDALKGKTATGAAKTALGLDAAAVVARLEAAVPERQLAVQTAQDKLSEALLAEQMGDAGAGVAACKKAHSAAQDGLADAERGLAAARRKQAAEQAAAAQQALAEQWSSCDEIQAAAAAEAQKVDAAAVVLAESFRALLARQTELVKVLPDSSHDFRIRLQGVAAFEAVNARLRQLCPELVGGHSISGLSIPTVPEAVAELYRAITLHHKKVA